MFANKRFIGLFISALLILSLTAFTTPASFNDKQTPGGFLSALNGTFTDNRTGFQYTFDLVAREYTDQPGAGQLTLLMNGPGISLCSAHGPGAEIDFSPGGEDFGGNNPLSEIQCGTAYGMPVSVKGCSIDLEFHGYSHSDYPFITYMGSMIFDLSLQRSAGPADAQVQLTLYTPKGQVKMNGSLSAAIGMDTCQ